jgi:hypothetical protein
MCAAERIRHMPGIKRGKDYHFHTKKFLQSSQMEVLFLEDIYTEQISGVDFDIMTIQMSIGEQIVKQKQYATVMKGYGLLLMVSFTNDEEEAELAKILESVTFK